MRRVYIVIVGLVIAVALSVVLQVLLPWALTALIAAIPLVVLRHGWRPYVAGFLIGFTTSLILYLTHPITSLIRLANIIGGLVGLPGPLMLVIYPLIYGILMALASGAYVAIETLINRDNQ